LGITAITEEKQAPETKENQDVNPNKELFLLALDEEKGNLFSFARKSFPYPIAGSILAELALLGKLGVGEKLHLARLFSKKSRKNLRRLAYS
jgi:hypothetical protein